MRATPAIGVELVKVFEGLHRVVTSAPEVTIAAYVCPAGYHTIGYGHVCPPDQAPIGADQAEAWLRSDLGRAERAVLAALPARALALADGAYAALVSLTFNIGTGAFRASTLCRHVRDGDMGAAAGEFAKWRFAGGRVLPGLVARRAAERSLFLA